MYYEDFDPDVKSQFIKSTRSYANLESESQLPVYGLKARDLLDTSQMKTLQIIRDKKLKSNQRKQFLRD